MWFWPKREEVELPVHPSLAYPSEAVLAAGSARSEWIVRCHTEATASLQNPNGDPIYKIVQLPVGKFVIRERSVWNAARELDVYLMDTFDQRPNEYGPKYWAEKSAAPTVSYVPVSEQIDTFEDAEAFLFRLACPEDFTHSYDFPPLKKREKTKAK